MAPKSHPVRAGTASLFSVLTHPDKSRWRLSYVLMVTLFVAYMDRLNISLALPLMAADLGWTAAETKEHGELLFSLFYIGYGFANIFLSPFAARLGPRKALTVIIILWSLFTALGAVLSQIFLALAASRVLLGLSEGVHFPMMNMLTKAWFGPQERSRANGIWIAGLYLAVLLSPVILVPMMSAFGWRTGFLLLAAIGVLITLPLILHVVHDRPELSARTTQREREDIERALDDKADRAPPRPRGHPLMLFANPSFVLLLTVGTLNNVVALGLVSWLPTFLVKTKGLAYDHLAYAASIPYAVGLGGIWLWATLGDRWNTRALLASGGYAAAAAAIYFSLIAPSLPLTLGLFSLAVFASAAWPSNEFALMQRVASPETVAGDVGLYNGLSAMIGGGLGPVVVSAIVGDPTAGQTADLLIVPAICIVISGLLAVTFMRLRY